MAIIDKIKLSGQTFEIQDSNASKTVELTQAEYDALATKDPNTYYIITDATPIDITNYYTKTQTDDLLDDKLDVTAYTPTDLSNYYTKSETSGATQIQTALNGKADNSTVNSLNNVVTAHTADTTVHVTANEKSTWNAKSDFSGDYNDLTNKLSAGTNITIVDNVISAEGGGKAVSGGTNISITTGETADTINCTLSGGTLINISNNKINCSAPIRYGTGSNSVIVGSSISTNKATGNDSIANGGDGNTASGQYSFAEGFYTQATKHSSHSEGWFTIASGNYSHTEGNHTKTTNESEHSSGKYNVSSSASTTFGDSGNTLFSVGNGTADNARHNAFEIRQNGDIYLTLDGQDVKLQDQLGGGGSSYTAGDGIDITNDVISVTGKADTSAVTEVNDVVTAHTANTTVHVTAQDKTNWNNKSDFSGDYNDLDNKPTIPSKTSDLTNDSDFATTGDVQTATNDMATKTWVGKQGYITSDDISGKADTSAVTAIQDSLSGYVTTDTEQTISGRKIFTYTSSTNKAIEFKQTDDSSKVGFRVRTSAATNNELASFEFRPNTFTIDGVQHPLIYFGHYRTTNAANAGVKQTVIGFRQYDQLNAAAYHYLLPLPDKAKTPFNLTTTFKDYYAPMGFKNGSTMITADNTGVVDLSSEFSGKVNASTYNSYTAATDTALASKADTATTYTKTEVDTALASKQTTLTAGTGISIVDNVISAEGGGSITIDPSLNTGSTNAVANSAITTAINDRATKGQAYGSTSFGSSSGKEYVQFQKVNGTRDSERYISKINGFMVWGTTNINACKNWELVETSAITTSVTSSSTDSQVPSAKAVNDKLGGLSLVKLTQAEYDALETKDNSTLYVIVN